MHRKKIGGKRRSYTYVLEGTPGDSPIHLQHHERGVPRAPFRVEEERARVPDVSRCDARTRPCSGDELGLSERPEHARLVIERGSEIPLGHFLVLRLTRAVLETD